MTIARLLDGVRTLALLADVAACLLAGTGCKHRQPLTPPPAATPSMVVTQNGLAFYVKGLRLPGTRQELRLKTGGSQSWVPLEQVASVHFRPVK
jgi:hypothetical protein